MSARAASLAAVAALAACTSRGAPSAAELGARLFHDPALSRPTGQACADCHAANVAFRDPESDASTSGGAVAGRFGPRNAPTAMYAGFAPPLHYDATSRAWIGGLFWDGRASSLEQQAAGPLLDRLEMNNPDQAAVAEAVRRAPYAPDFREVFGARALDDPETAFAHVTEALAAFERTPALAPFSSKYDRYLAGHATLTASEQRGLEVFEDPARGDCASCHPSRPSADGTPPLFTNFRYANLGLPTYRNSRFVAPAGGERYVDHGLMTTVGDPAQDGKFRVPTLRNIARTGPYGHNGYFENLQYMVDFLNTRDRRSPDPAVKPWAAPEIPATIEPGRLGHLGLTPEEVDDVVSFLGTLTDAPPPP